MICKTIDEAFELYKEDLITKGQKIEDERGDKLYQLPFYSITFKDYITKVGNVEDIPIPRSSILNNEGLNDYANQLLDGDIHNFVYTYGNRFIKHFGINQYNVMVRRLEKNIHSRRSVAVTYNPLEDFDKEDIPCLIMIKLCEFKGKLDMGVVFRSNDVKYAFPSNMYGLMNVHKYLCDKVGMPIGNLHYVSFDGHYKIV